MEWTTLEDVEWWIEQIANAKPGVEFQGPDFLRPYHFAVLANQMHRLGAIEVTVPEALQGYASRMRLWQSVGLEPPTRVNERNPGGRFHPLSPIVSETTAQNIATDILEVFRGAGTSDKATLNAIDTALSEIFSNCFFHAAGGREICGLACAQSWPHALLAQVVVADIGIGIRSSLGANPAYRERLQRENAAELATELGVTSKPAPGGAHSGYGLTVARQLMEKHGGSFLLLSGNEAIRATEHGSQARELRVPWSGTIVALEWRTDRPFDIGAVYGNWPKDGDSDEFF
jgi:anti-sigma regulatory factor (Ser/Thr protein kinase)